MLVNVDIAREARATSLDICWRYQTDIARPGAGQDKD